jgi:hypothetical protein
MRSRVLMTPETFPQGDVGVLLVHGIGDHEEGTTITSLGEPLLDWLREWLWAGSGRRARHTQADSPQRATVPQGQIGSRGDVIVEKARLHAVRTESESPAYALARITTHGAAADNSRTESWLLCEAWWGASVLPPASLTLLRWLWMRGPLLTYWHFFQGREVTASRGVWAIVIAGVSQIVVTVAIALWFVPIDRWRRAVVSATRALTLTLGDSYALLEQEIQRAALVERVRQSLAWLSARTQRVIVIAHSQGGALAYEALRGMPCEKLRMLITVGSGLEKLEFLRAARYRRAGIVQAAIAFPLLAAGVLLELWGWSGQRSPVLIVAGVLVLFAVLGIFQSLSDKFVHYREDLAKNLQPLSGLDMDSWVDVYASHDLVSGGRESAFTAAESHVTGEVLNECSFFRDHTTYFANRIEFLAMVWMVLRRESNLVLFADEDIPRLLRHAKLHQQRTRMLSALRYVIAAALLIFIVFRADALVTLGNSVSDSLQNASLTEILRPVAWVASGVTHIIQSLLPRAVAARNLVGPWLLGTLALLAPIVLWWVIVRGIWLALCKSQWRAVCRRDDVLHDRKSEILQRAVRLVFFASGCLILVAAVITAFREEDLTVQLLSKAVSISISGFMLALGAIGAAAAPWSAEIQVKEAWRKPGVALPRRAWETVTQIFLMLLSASIWLAMMFALSFWIYRPFRQIGWIGPLVVSGVLLTWLLFILGRIASGVRQRHSSNATAQPRA